MSSAATLFLAGFTLNSAEPQLSDSELPGEIIELRPHDTNAAAKVFYTQGNENRRRVLLGMSIHRGGRLEVETGGFAKIQWQSGKVTTARPTEVGPGVLIVPEKPEEAWLRLIRGLFSFAGRGRGRTQFTTGQAVGGSKETVFEVNVDDDRTFVTVIEGTVTVAGKNGIGQLELTGHGAANAERCIVEAGQAPRQLAATNIVQWWLYYPGVIDLAELPLNESSRKLLASSLQAYVEGDIKHALELYPEGHVPGDDAERVYTAGLRVIGNQPLEARRLLAETTTQPALTNALHMLISAVNLDGFVTNASPITASEWLAYSYLLQSHHQLHAALEAARQATNSADFGYAWEHLAELHFGGGSIADAEAALTNALRLSPRNAQAHALRGFLLAAENSISAARTNFEHAIKLDPSLGNAWLGRGLCRIRQRDTAGGVADLHTAAALEPNRALLRSYLAKGLQLEGDSTNALKELAVAKSLDPKDPTAWFYEALTLYDKNRLNEAITNLEHSVELNDNRTLFRSQLRLDEDRAVRSTGLARFYRRNGLLDVSLREAARAVGDDYLDYSAHLFLAESFDALRDPTRFNLRYETAWFNELLLANLLAPVGAGLFSPNISQQEYTRLFERDRLSLTSVSEYRSDGQFRQLALQSGTFGRTSWSLDLDYQHNDGVRVNNDLDRIEWYSQIKQQIGPRDTALFLTKFQNYTSGDNFQYLDQTNARPYFRFDEEQEPIVLGGWRHEWTPDSQTLLLGGRLHNEQHFADRDFPQQTLESIGSASKRTEYPFDLIYRGRFEGYTVEANHILKLNDHTLLTGLRTQFGEFDSSSTLTSTNSTMVALFGTNTTDHVNEDFRRITLYAYDQWSPLRNLTLIGGVAWDDLRFPENFRNPPLERGQDHRSRVLPKAAVLWSICPEVTLRSAYARSLGGVTLDQSFQLEPVQLAGFSQSYRTIIPESVVGSVAAHDLDLGGIALDVKLPSHTYIGLQAQYLRSKVDQTVGMLTVAFDQPTPLGAVGGITNVSNGLIFEERSLGMTLDQMFGDQWSVGAAYRLIDSRLGDRLPAAASFRDLAANLHEMKLHLLWNHSSGFFAGVESLSLWQHATAPDRHSDESLNQLNLQAGWRFPRSRGDVAIGVLNALNENYRLDPISGYPELPRKAVFYARLGLNF